MYKYIYKKYTLPGNFTHMHAHTHVDIVHRHPGATGLISIFYFVYTHPMSRK